MVLPVPFRKNQHCTSCQAEAATSRAADKTRTNQGWSFSPESYPPAYSLDTLHDCVDDISDHAATLSRWSSLFRTGIPQT